MIEIFEIRRNNAIYLRDIYCDGNSAEFARRVGKAKGLMNRYIGGSSDKKNIGDKVARDIEKAFSMPQNWLDQQFYSNDDGGDLSDSRALTKMNDYEQKGFVVFNHGMNARVLIREFKSIFTGK